MSSLTLLLCDDHHVLYRSGTRRVAQAGRKNHGVHLTFIFHAFFIYRKQQLLKLFITEFFSFYSPKLISKSIGE